MRDYIVSKKSRPAGGIKGCLVFIVTVVLILIIIIALQVQAYTAFQQPTSTKGGEFIVKQGETLDVVAANLIQQGYLRDTTLFGVPAYKVYLRLQDIDVSAIQAGTFTIPDNATPEEIFMQFKDDGCTEVQVTLREGIRIEEQADVLSKAFTGKKKATFSKSEFISIAKNFQALPGEYEFSMNVPKNLEGYLFPDTYRMCSNVSSRDVVFVLLKNFEKKGYLPYKNLFTNNTLKFSDVINIASMVEREARTKEEKAMIADIILRRIQYDIPLGIDATTQYEYGYSTTQQTWWRKGTELDAVIGVDGAYNTRKNLGLPPTPISNPGADSIDAVLEPIANPYLFYITGNDGKMYYAKTLNEHNVNVCKHITLRC